MIKRVHADVLGHCLSIDELNQLRKKNKYQYWIICSVFILISIGTLLVMGLEFVNQTLTIQQLFVGCLLVGVVYVNCSQLHGTILENLQSLEFISPETHTPYYLTLEKIAHQRDIRSYLKRVVAQQRQLTLSEYRAILRHNGQFGEGSDSHHALAFWHELQQSC